MTTLFMEEPTAFFVARYVKGARFTRFSGEIVDGQVRGWGFVTTPPSVLNHEEADIILRWAKTNWPGLDFRIEAADA